MRTQDDVMPSAESDSDHKESAVEVPGTILNWAQFAGAENFICMKTENFLLLLLDRKLDLTETGRARDETSSTDLIFQLKKEPMTTKY